MALQLDADQKSPFHESVALESETDSDEYVASTRTRLKGGQSAHILSCISIEMSLLSMFVLAAAAGLALYIREKCIQAEAPTDYLQARALIVAIAMSPRIIAKQFANVSIPGHTIGDIKISKTLPW